MRIRIVLTEPLEKKHRDRFRGMLNGLDRIEKIDAVSIADAEDKAAAAEKVMAESEGMLIVFYGSEEGRYCSMKAAADLSYSCFTDVLDFEHGRVHKKIYSTHADGFFKIPKKGAVIVLLQGGPVAEGPDCRIDDLVPAEVVCEKEESGKAGIVKVDEKQDLWGLDQAELVFIGGRGLKKKENFDRLTEAGKKYGAAVGCTRAAALAGWADYSRVVGVSGTQIRPEICILFGVSGAAPFLFGIENAKTVIAINKDDKAPVFDVADYGIVKDCISIVKGLMEGE